MFLLETSTLPVPVGTRIIFSLPAAAVSVSAPLFEVSEGETSEPNVPAPLA